MTWTGAPLKDGTRINGDSSDETGGDPDGALPDPTGLADMPSAFDDDRRKNCRKDDILFLAKPAISSHYLVVDRCRSQQRGGPQHCLRGRGK